MPRGIIHIRGVSLSYYEQGHGQQSILLLHGSNQSLDTFSPQLSSPLLSKYHVIALDLPGHGESSPSSHPSMLELTAIVKEFALKKISNPYVIVGFSLGGHIALGMVEAGLKPKGLVLISTPPARKPIDMTEMFQVTGPMGLLYKSDITSEESVTLARAFYHHGSSVDQELADLKKVAVSFKELFPATLFGGEHIDEQKTIKEIEIPVLVATAEHDTFVQNQHILNHLPKNPLLKSYPAGHNLHRETTDQFTADLTHFVTNVFDRG